MFHSSTEHWPEIDLPDVNSLYGFAFIVIYTHMVYSMIYCTAGKLRQAKVWPTYHDSLNLPNSSLPAMRIM